MHEENGSTGNRISKRAVVIGAGVTGLAAATVLSKFSEEVVIVERDSLPLSPAFRKGVPQGRQPHGLLAGSMDALNYLFPGFSEDLARAGAVPFDPGHDAVLEIPGVPSYPHRHTGLTSHAMSRPLFELTLRQRAAQIPNLTIEGQCRVLSIRGTADGSRVTGIWYQHGDAGIQELTADIVVDASGDGNLTLDYLRSAGREVPRVTTVGIDVRYSSRFYAGATPPAGCQVLLTFPKAPDHARFGYLLAAENNEWQALLVGRGNDVPPVEDDAFLRYAQQLETDTLYNAIKDAEPRTAISRFAFPESRWRHFSECEDFPRGLLPIGDALCRLNPVWGQGITVALQESRLLDCLLRTQTQNSDAIASLTRTYLAQVEGLIEDPWQMSAVPDFVYPETRGERPADLKERLQYQNALQRLAADDPEVFQALIRVRHLLAPAETLGSPEIRSKIEQIAASSVA